MRKNGFILFTGILIGLLSVTGIALGQTASQTGSLTISSLDIVPLGEPNSFSFESAFIPNQPGTINLYHTLNPSNPAETFRLEDPDAGGRFDLTMSMTDLNPVSGGDDVIRFTNIALVSLSESLTEEVDGPPTNNPPGAPLGDFFVPLYCNWDPLTIPNMWDACDGIMFNFIEPAAGTTNLTNDINPGNATIDVADASQLTNPNTSPHSIVIEGDIIDYTGKNVNQLTGVTGIDAPHPNGTPITQYARSSVDQTIISNTNPANTGVYSVGFGLRLAINQTIVPGDYSGTITFTLTKF